MIRLMKKEKSLIPYCNSEVSKLGTCIPVYYTSLSIYCVVSNFGSVAKAFSGLRNLEKEINS